MRRVVLLLVAILCLLAGVVMLPTPFPVGAVLLLTGTSLLLMASPGLQRWFYLRRRSLPAIDRRLQVFEAYLPEIVRRALNNGRLRQG